MAAKDRIMKVEYSSNNSGGKWWLSDDDWENLEKAGWRVHWFKERFLGALATSASKETDSIGDLLRQFEEITGENVSDEGCNCCGAPHSFSWTNEDDSYDYCSGEDCLSYMYDNVPSSFRDAVEAMNK